MSKDLHLLVNTARHHLHQPYVTLLNVVNTDREHYGASREDRLDRAKGVMGTCVILQQ